jgi:homoserine O-acetyltransferase
MAAAPDMLRGHLDIPKIQTIVGGSIGAFQAIEWCIVQPQIFDSLIFIAASARSSPWAIAWGEAQRMAIEADPTFFADTPHGGAAGMAAARAIGMLAYRTCHAFNHTQADTERGSQVGNYRAASYQRYQGEKLAKRFDAYSYYRLSQMLDTHDISRSRDSMENVLRSIAIPALVVGIDSDLLFPCSEQKFMADIMPRAGYAQISSIYGHDAFLIEYEQLTKIISPFVGG